MHNSPQPHLLTKSTATIKFKRLHVIDALRGFALFGILIIHSYASFIDLFEAGVHDSAFRGINKIIDASVGKLFSNTLYSIFSFLFGLSFAIQLQSASASGRPFTGRFVWRLIILMAIGYSHSLIFSRDILQLYALLGFLLIFFARAKNGIVLIASASMFMVSFLLIFFQDALRYTIIQIGEVTTQSHLLRLIGLHKIEAQLMNGRFFSTAGLFLLGLSSGRKNIFEDNPKNRSRFWKIFVICLLIMVTSSIAFQIFKAKNAPDNILNTTFAVERLAQSFFYVALIVKLYKLRIFQRIWAVLIPTGKMGLTTYISQSLFITVFFSSSMSSTVAQMEPVSILGFTSIFFICQTVFASWWLSRFRYGPLEWVWRSLTYLKLQPMSKVQYQSDRQSV